MKSFSYALVASLSAVSLAAVLLWTRPASAQDARVVSPVSADNTYSATSIDGSLQQALDAALVKAQAAAAVGPNGTTVADAIFNWQLVSVTGTMGGFTGKRDVTVKIQILK